MMLPIVLKQKCPICKSEVCRDALSFLENQFCSPCTMAALALKQGERVSVRTRANGYWEAAILQESA